MNVTDAQLNEREVYITMICQNDVKKHDRTSLPRLESNFIPKGTARRLSWLLKISRNFPGQRGPLQTRSATVLSSFTVVSKAKSSSTSPRKVPVTTHAAILFKVILQAPLLLVIIGETFAASDFGIIPVFERRKRYLLHDH